MSGSEDFTTKTILRWRSSGPMWNNCSVAGFESSHMTHVQKRCISTDACGPVWGVLSQLKLWHTSTLRLENLIGYFSVEKTSGWLVNCLDMIGAICHLAFLSRKEKNRVWLLICWIDVTYKNTEKHLCFVNVNVWSFRLQSFPNLNQVLKFVICHCTNLGRK